MKVSIITATYNSGKTIQRAIDSIASQDYNNIEYIIIDGGSTDNTLQIISENQDKISKFVSEKDKGIYDALNKGIRLAGGEIIGFLNSDDVYNNKYIVSKIVNSFEKKKADIVYGDLVYQSKDINNEKTIRYWKSNIFNLDYLKYGWMPPHPTLYCTKEVYDRYGLYDDNFKISADYEFILRVFKEPSLVKTYIPNVLVRMDMGGISNNSLMNIYRKSKEDYNAIKRNDIGGFFTLLCKNFRKLKQFTKKI